MPSEADLTRKIKKGLEEDGCYVAKIHGGRYSAGIPDLLVCYEGRFFGLEVKLPKKERTVTVLQLNNLEGIIDAGGGAAVVTSLMQARAVIRGHSSQ